MFKTQSSSSTLLATPKLLLSHHFTILQVTYCVMRLFCWSRVFKNAGYFDEVNIETISCTLEYFRLSDSTSCGSFDGCGKDYTELQTVSELNTPYENTFMDKKLQSTQKGEFNSKQFGWVIYLWLGSMVKKFESTLKD